MASASTSGYQVYLHTGPDHDELLTVDAAERLISELEAAIKDVRHAVSEVVNQTLVSGEKAPDPAVLPEPEVAAEEAEKPAAPKRRRAPAKPRAPRKKKA